MARAVWALKLSPIRPVYGRGGGAAPDTPAWRAPPLCRGHGKHGAHRCGGRATLTASHALDMFSKHRYRPAMPHDGADHR
jgi:hypothetical protein